MNTKESTSTSSDKDNATTVVDFFINNDRLLQEANMGGKIKVPGGFINPIVLSLPSVCLNDCLFCNKTGQNDIAYVGYDAITDGLCQIVRKRRRIGRLVICGYEPLTFPNIVEIIERGKEIGFSEIEIMTSGNTLNIPGFVQKLAKAGVTHFVVPLYGHNAKLHDFIVGNKGAFHDVMGGIKKVKKLGAEVAVYSLALNQNIKHMDKINDFVQNELKCPFIFGPVRNKKNYREACPRLSEIGDKIKKAYAFGFPLCISYFHDHNPEDYTIDKLVQKSIDAAFNYMYFAYQPTEKVRGICDKCQMNNKCVGVLQDYIKFFGLEKVKNELKPYKKTNYVQD